MDHTHENESQEGRINCPICKDLAPKPIDREPIYSSPIRGKPGLLSPHKLVDGVMTICHNPDCKICHSSLGLTSDIVYHLDLPGPCPKCGDYSCCEGIEKERIFKIK